MVTGKRKLNEAIEAMKAEARKEIVYEQLIEDAVISIKLREEDGQAIKIGGSRGRKFVLGLAAGVIIAAGIFGVYFGRTSAKQQDAGKETYADMMTMSALKKVYDDGGLEAVERHLDKAGARTVIQKGEMISLSSILEELNNGNGKSGERK